MPKLPPSAPPENDPSSSDDAENEHESEYDEGSAILVDEQDEEEDVVPSRKVEIDNTVRRTRLPLSSLFRPFFFFLVSFSFFRRRR